MGEWTVRSPCRNPPSGRLLEVKERLQGAPLRFSLERWWVTESLAVGRWLASDDRYVAAGTSSWGCWWRGRPYGAYRIHRPDGSLRSYRIDVVEAVRITADVVRYRDLLLDAWIIAVRCAPPGGRRRSGRCFGCGRALPGAAAAHLPHQGAD